MELMYHPHVFKTQLCHSIAFGPCLKKHYCPFAHGPEELRQGKFDANETETRFFPNFPENGTPHTPNVSHLQPLANPVQNGDFREVTDRLKIQLLDLVDEIASIHFDQARQSQLQKPQDLEQLSRLGVAYYSSLPAVDLDIMNAQCLAVLELIAQAKEQQSHEDDAGNGELSLDTPNGGHASPN